VETNERLFVYARFFSEKGLQKNALTVETYEGTFKLINNNFLYGGM